MPAREIQTYEDDTRLHFDVESDLPRFQGCCWPSNTVHSTGYRSLCSSPRPGQGYDGMIVRSPWNRKLLPGCEEDRLLCKSDPTHSTLLNAFYLTKLVQQQCCYPLLKERGPLGHTHTIVVGDATLLAKHCCGAYGHHWTLMRDYLRFLCHRH